MVKALKASEMTEMTEMLTFSDTPQVTTSRPVARKAGLHGRSK
jgi:hypothetical protein